MSDRITQLIRELEEEVQILREQNQGLRGELNVTFGELEYLREWLDELGIPAPDRMTVGEELEIRQRLEGRS